MRALPDATALSYMQVGTAVAVSLHAAAVSSLLRTCMQCSHERDRAEQAWRGDRLTESRRCAAPAPAQPFPDHSTPCCTASLPNYCCLAGAVAEREGAGAAQPPGVVWHQGRPRHAAAVHTLRCVCTRLITYQPSCSDGIYRMHPCSCCPTPWGVPLAAQRCCCLRKRHICPLTDWRMNHSLAAPTCSSLQAGRQCGWRWLPSSLRGRT